jgi:hypothetical protein
MPPRPALWVGVVVAAAGLGGCFDRVAVPLNKPGATVTCFGEDNVLPERDFSKTGRNLCVAACRSFDFVPGKPVTDHGGLSPRQNPGTPAACL